MGRFRILALLAVVLSAACATLGTQSTDGVNLPTSDVGPFRALAKTEDLGAAPYVLAGFNDVPYVEPAVLPLGADPSSLDVALYFGATSGTNGGGQGTILRTRATDGVSFFGTAASYPDAPKLVLAASNAWEEGNVHSPSVLSAGGQVFLYYAAAGGIGLATSADGFTFTKHAGAVLAPDPTVLWETSAPTQPSVAVFPGGTWHMLYAAGVSIGEATSTDGIAWTRVDGDPSTPAMDPVLAPSPAESPEALDAGGTPFDYGQVADPCLLPRVDPAGNTQVRVLYTGYAAAPGAAVRASAIGFAARYGAAGALVRSGSPVYSVGKHEAAPALFEWSAGSLLYVHEDSVGTPLYPEIAAGVFPVTLTLPTPSAYASSP